MTRRTSLLFSSLLFSLTASSTIQGQQGEGQGYWLAPSQHDLTVGPGFVHCPCTLGPGCISPPWSDPPCVDPGVTPPVHNCWRFKAVHMALIPKGQNVGKVLVWDQRLPCELGSGPWQRWAIIDPATSPPSVLTNQELSIPLPGAIDGDLFCSGHAWTPNGDLLVAGGTAQYPDPPPPSQFSGAKIAYLYKPDVGPFGTWVKQDDMDRDRWYPTITLNWDGIMMVSGGTHNGVVENTYEMFDPDPLQPGWRPTPWNPMQRWFPGPTTTDFEEYPRMHLLSSGWIFMSGPHRDSQLTLAGSMGWVPTDLSNVFRHDGSSILFPMVHGKPDTVMILGGAMDFGTPPIYDSTETCLPTQGVGAWNWSDGPKMLEDRAFLNTVILPDGSVFVVGGGGFNSQGIPEFWKAPEIFKDGIWELKAPHVSNRDYHSTAVLLDDGRVFCGGGDNRNWDYEIYYPPYLEVENENNPRPTNVQWVAPAQTPNVLNYHAVNPQSYVLSFNNLPLGISIGHVVLMAPGSVTHHSDMGQRYVDLPIVSQTSSTVTFQGPYNQCAAPNPQHSCAPPGYYMLFLVTNTGFVSNAIWIEVKHL